MIVGGWLGLVVVSSGAICLVLRFGLGFKEVFFVVLGFVFVQTVQFTSVVFVVAVLR